MDVLGKIGRAFIFKGAVMLCIHLGVRVHTAQLSALVYSRNTVHSLPCVSLITPFSFFMQNTLCMLSYVVLTNTYMFLCV